MTTYHYSISPQSSNYLFQQKSIKCKYSHALGLGPMVGESTQSYLALCLTMGM